MSWPDFDFWAPVLEPCGAPPHFLEFVISRGVGGSKLVFVVPVGNQLAIDQQLVLYLFFPNFFFIWWGPGARGYTPKSIPEVTSSINHISVKTNLFNHIITHLLYL